MYVRRDPGSDLDGQFFQKVERSEGLPFWAGATERNNMQPETTNSGGGRGLPGFGWPWGRWLG
jgi:hypothetical protein